MFIRICIHFYVSIQVAEVVGRTGSEGGARAGGGDLAAESDLDVGGDLRCRRVALNRLEEVRARHQSRAQKVSESLS